MRFYSSVEVGPDCIIHKGVSVIPFKKGLKIIFRGQNSIGAYSVFQGSAPIYFGQKTFCGQFCVFGSNESITIGNNVMIAQSVSIRDTDHAFSDISIPMNAQGIETDPVIIEDDTWIGHGAVITKGITISHGSIVGAGAIVTKNIPAYSIVVGSPARVIGSRLDRNKSG